MTASTEVQRADSAPLNTFDNGRIDIFDRVQAGRFFVGLGDFVPAAVPITSGLACVPVLLHCHGLRSAVKFLLVCLYSASNCQS